MSCAHTGSSGSGNTAAPPRKAYAMLAPSLPDQNQLYAYYLTRCGHHGVRKPHWAVLALLAEDAPSQQLRLATEAAERGVMAADLALTEDGSDGDGSATRAAVVALVHQRTFRLCDDGAAGEPIYVGARGMLPVLDLVAELPLLVELDLSNISSWYDSDTIAQGQDGSVTGNDVAFRLCEVLPRLRRLCVVNLLNHPIGCAAGERLLYAVQDAPSIVELRLETRGLSAQILQALQQTLREHQQTAGREPTLQLTANEYTVPPYIAALPRLDRKTLREQQVLRAMLEGDANFSAVVTADELDEMVLTARVMSTTEAIFRCGKAGIRGDGVDLFVIKSGVLRVHEDLAGATLSRGDYFGDAYDATIVPCSPFVEEERGLVYAIPLASCARVTAQWSARVAEAWPWLQRTPVFQSVGAWTQLRVCTCAVMTRHEPAETVVEVGSGEGAVNVVCDGTYAALDVRDGDTAQFSKRNVRGLFSRYDVFGTEALVARKHTSSVRIKAGRDNDACYRVLHVRGCGVRLLQQQLRHVFVALARAYSLHADLCAGETQPSEV